MTAVQRDSDPMPTPFAHRLDSLARARPAHPAVVMPGTSIDYPALADRVARRASALARAGCSTARPVGVSVGDDLENLVSTLALLRLGVPQIPFPAADPLPLRRDLARRLSMSHVVADDDAQAIEGVATIRIDRIASTPGPAPGGDAYRDDAHAFFSTSSGTTGKPKLFGYSQRMFGDRADLIARALGYADDERVMVAMPVVTQNGKFSRLIALWRGATVVLPGDAGDSTSSLFELCAGLRVTYLQLTVLQARNLMIAAGADRRLPPHTRVFLGAARMPAGFPHEFHRRVGASVYDRYGATEIGLFATTWPAGDRGVDDSVGTPIAGVEVEIVDASGALLPRGATGEIRARSASMTTAYFDDAAATRRHFRDGWFWPGDMGAMTESGVLRYLGRKDDMMVLNGINIFPAEIERVLEGHPAVATSAAFPIASPNYGEIPAAAVELRAGAHADADELSRYARRELGVRAPRVVVVLKALPRNAAGKVAKLELPALVASRASLP